MCEHTSNALGVTERLCCMVWTQLWWPVLIHRLFDICNTNEIADSITSWFTKQQTACSTLHAQKKIQVM